MYTTRSMLRVNSGLMVPDMDKLTVSVRLADWLCCRLYSKWWLNVNFGGAFVCVCSYRLRSQPVSGFSLFLVRG